MIAGLRSRALTNPKAIRFQLTALMDLLLIVVFAQFLELREQAEATQIKQQQVLSSVTAEHALQQEKLLSDLEEAQSQNELLQAAQDAQAELLTRSMATVKTLFDIDETLPADSALLTRVALQAKSLSAADGETVARFLISHEELLKRAEVWTIHGKSSGEIELTANGVTQGFRLERDGQDARVEEFAERLFSAYKKLSQPKGLVVMILSYDLRATAGVYQVMIDGMTNAIERLRNDAMQTRFEFTVIGPTSDPSK